MAIKKLLLLVLVVLIFQSCIPYKIKPKLREDHVQKANKFLKKLPKRYAYIFKDPKDANEFYTYIYYKFNPNPSFPEYNIPIEIDGTPYYLSFYEAERTTETLNLVPIITDNILESKGHTRLLQNTYTSRNGSWYLVFLLSDKNLNDAINPNYPKHQQIISYLSALKKEYLTTANYKELLLTSQ